MYACRRARQGREDHHRDGAVHSAGLHPGLGGRGQKSAAGGIEPRGTYTFVLCCVSGIVCVVAEQSSRWLCAATTSTCSVHCTLVRCCDNAGPVCHAVLVVRRERNVW
jgi:hypothetical protein